MNLIELEQVTNMGILVGKILVNSAHISVLNASGDSGLCVVLLVGGQTLYVSNSLAEIKEKIFDEDQTK